MREMKSEARWAAIATTLLFVGMPSIGVSSELDKNLICSDESVRGYQRIQVQAGRMIVGHALNPGTPDQHSVIHENFQNLSFDDGKTYFIVAHKESGELFTSDCDEQTCSFDEVSEPNNQCQMMNYIGGNMDSTACMFFAVRFQDENFCLQQPSAK